MASKGVGNLRALSCLPKFWTRQPVPNVMAQIGLTLRFSYTFKASPVSENIAESK